MALSFWDVGVLNFVVLAFGFCRLSLFFVLEFDFGILDLGCGILFSRFGCFEFLILQFWIFGVLILDFGSWNLRMWGLDEFKFIGHPQKSRN